MYLENDFMAICSFLGSGGGASECLDLDLERPSSPGIIGISSGLPRSSAHTSEGGLDLAGDGNLASRIEVDATEGLIVPSADARSCGIGRCEVSSSGNS